MYGFFLLLFLLIWLLLKIIIHFGWAHVALVQRFYCHFCYGTQHNAHFTKHTYYSTPDSPFTHIMISNFKYAQVAVHIERNVSTIRFQFGFQDEWRQKKSYIIFDAYARANLVKKIFCAIKWWRRIQYDSHWKKKQKKIWMNEWNKMEWPSTHMPNCATLRVLPFFRIFFTSGEFIWYSKSIRWRKFNK